VPDNNQRLNAALKYASLGYAVFPLQPNSKVPFAGFHWPMEATSDPEVIRAWWERLPEANIGIACGAPSGITVLDFDCKDGKPGMALAANLLGSDWQSQYDHIRTPSQGAHIYLPYSEALGNRKRADLGLDIQGTGSYVVAPPSVLENGPYLRVVGQELPGPVVDTVVESLMAQLGQGVTKARGDQRLPADWKDTQFNPPFWVELRLPPKVQPFWFDGDLGEYDTRSEAIYGVATALHHMKLPPQCVLQAMVDNHWCMDVAMADSRRPEGGDSAAQWLWAYAVMPCTPLNPFADTGVAYHTEMPQTEQSGASVPLPVVQPQEAAVEVDPFKAAMAHVQGLLPGQYDKVNAALSNIAIMSLMPHEEDLVLGALAQAVGMKLVPLRNTLKRVRQGHDAEQEQARREAQQGKGLAARYVYVARQDRVWDSVEHCFLTPTAFGNMHGTEARERFINDGLMPRVSQMTYLPINPHSPLFDEADRTMGGWRFPRDTTTGEPRLNTWAPVRGLNPKLDATASDIKPWLLHLRDGLRLPEVERLHLISYLAHMVQFPEQKINHMLVLGGNQGSGKGFALQPVYAALGSDNIKSVRQNVLDSNFDPDVQHAKVLEIEELASSDWDRARASVVYNNLKPYGAAPPMRLSIVLKNMNAIEIPNIVQVLAMTNHRNAMVLEQDDRRCAMLWAPGRRMREETAAAMWRWLEEPQTNLGGHTGAQAVAGFLYGFDVSEFNPKAPPPVTAWKAEVMESSLTDAARSVLRVVETAQLPDVVDVRELLARVREDLILAGEDVRGRPMTERRLLSALDQLAMPHRRVNPPRAGARQPNKVRLVALRNVEEWGLRESRDWLLLS
jgi:hypothetical protein